MNLRVVKFIEIDSRMVVDRGWGAEGSGELSNRYRVSFLQDEEF